MNSKSLQKIILTVGYLTIFTILFVIFKTENANGYELTIYESFPFYFFYLFSICYFCGYLVIYKIINNKVNNDTYIILAFSLVLITNWLIILLGNLHGYWLYGRGEGDILTHIGYMKDVKLNGFVTEFNFYPILHVTGATISYITNLSLENTSSLIPIIFSLSLTGYIYFLSSSMIENKWDKILMTTFSTLLIFSTFSLRIHPSVLSITAIPLILGLYQKKMFMHKRQVEYSALAIILLFFITFMHPMSTVFLIIILICYSLIIYSYNHIYHNSTNKNVISDRILAIPIVITIVAFFTWYFSYYSITNYSADVFNSIIYELESTETIVGYYGGLYSTTNLSLFSTVKYLIWNYMHLLLLLGIATIYIIFNVHTFLNKKKVSFIDFTYTSLQSISLLLAIVFLIGYFVEFEVLRVTRLAIIFSIISCGMFSLKIIKINRKYLLFPFILVILLSSFFIFNVYSSPNTSSPNYQMTFMEYSGVEWLITYFDNDIPIVSNTNVKKNQDYILSRNESYYSRMLYIRKNLPNEFGYENYASLSEAVSVELEVNKPFYTTYDKYMEINHQILPIEVRSMTRTYKKDNIKNDISVNIIYTNGEHENWLVKNN